MTACINNTPNKLSLSKQIKRTFNNYQKKIKPLTWYRYNAGSLGERYTRYSEYKISYMFAIGVVSDVKSAIQIKTNK